jgi:S1-C subfamily serine protease
MLLAAILILPAAQGAGPDSRAIYEKAAPGVVAVRAMAPLGERSGSGFVLSTDGLILTSYAVCPEGAKEIRVWVKGPRLHTAELVGTSLRDEIALLRIRPRGDLKPLELGESAALKPGQVSYTLGNAANSIIDNDEPSFNAGIVSGFYTLLEPRANSTYTGEVFETTAAVNVGMEGAPCLDAAGRVTGLVTLNYSPNRFLGAAIPIDTLKRPIERLRAAKAPETAAPEAAGEGYLGLTVKRQGAKFVAGEVDPDGPAALAGIRKGDVLSVFVGSPLKSEKEAAERLKGLEAGSIVWITVGEGPKAENVKIVLEKKK